MSELDQIKKAALIAWNNSIADEVKIKSITDLRYGEQFIFLLQLSDSSQVYQPCSTVEDRFRHIKNYLDGFYQTTFTGSSQITDLSVILHPSAPEKELEWQLAKLLLALLGAFVQDKQKEMFVDKALSLSVEVQAEIMQMLSPLLSKDMALMEDFGEVLSKRTGSVRDSPIPHHPPLNANNSHVSSVQEINSPLRMLTLGSPAVTPLSALMHSPQLAQKALLRQKERDIRRLELTLHNEQHLRSELELDLKDKANVLEEKEKKIRELERQLKEQRKLQDAVDEMEQLKSEHEKLLQDLQRSQVKLKDYQDLREHVTYLEKENKENLAQYNQMKENIQTLEGVKKSLEEYRTKCHKQDLQISEFESLLFHRSSEIEQLQGQLQQVDDSRKSALNQRDSIRKEKEELEELLSSGGHMGFSGESMGVISDKRISELEVELNQMKSSWVDPVSHESVQKDLTDASQARDTYQEKFVETHKQLLESQAKLEQINIRVTSLEENLSSSETTISAQTDKMKSQTDELDKQQDTISQLRMSEGQLTLAKEELEGSVTHLEKELSRCQAEMQLLVQEAEMEKQISETRRQTMAASVDQVMAQKKSVEQQLNKENLSLKQKLEDLTVKFKNQEEEAAQKEESLKTKHQSALSSLKQAEILLDNERWTKDSTIKALKEEMQGLKEEIQETEKRLNQQISTLNTDKSELQVRFSQEHTTQEEKNTNLIQEFEKLKSKAKEKQEGMSEEIQALTAELETARNELDRAKIEEEHSHKSWEVKYSKLDQKYIEQVESLNSELASLNDKLQWSLHDQQTLTDEITELKENLSQKSSEIENLTNCLDTSKQTMSDEQQKKLNLEKEINTLKTELSAEKAKHIDIVEQINTDHCESLTQLERMLSEEKRSAEELHRSSNVAILQLKKKIDDLSAQGKSAEEKSSLCKNELEQRIKSLEKQLDEDSCNSTSTIQSLQNELEQDRITAAVTQERLSQELQNVKQQLASITEEHETVVNKDKEINVKVKELLNQAAVKDTEIRSLHEKCEKMGEDLVEKSGQIALLKKVAETKQGDNDKLSENNNSLQKRVTELENKVIAGDEICERINRDLRVTETRLGESESSVQSLQKSRDELKVENCKLCGQVTSLKNTLETVRKESEKWRQSTESLEQEKGALEKKVEELVLIKEECCTNITGLQNELQDVKSRLKDCQDDLTISAQEKDRLQESVNRMETELQSLSCTLENERANSEVLAKKNSELESQISSIKHEMEAENTRVKNLLSDNNEIKNRAEMLQSNKEELESKIEQLLNGKEEVGKILEMSSRDKQEVEERNQILLSEKVEVQSRVEQLLTEKEESETRLENVLSEKCEIERRVEMLLSDQEEMRLRIQKLLGDKDETEKMLETVSGHKHELTCTIEKLLSDKDESEQKLVQLQSDIGDMEKTMNGLKSENEKLSSCLQSHQNSEDEIHREKTVLQEQVTALQTEVESLTLANTENLNKLEQLSHKLEQEIGKKDEELDHIKQQCSEKEVETLNLMEKYEQILSTETDKHQMAVSKMKCQYDEERDQLVKSHEEKLKEVIVELTSTNQELKDANQRQKRYEEMIVELESKLNGEVSANEEMTKSHYDKIQDLQNELGAQINKCGWLEEQCKETGKEVERYWKSQLEQLEEEYHNANMEQKQEYHSQMVDQEMNLEAKHEALIQEKEMILLNQKLAYQDRVNHLETKLSQKQTELETVSEKLRSEKESTENEYKEKLAKLESLLRTEIQSHREIKDEMEKYKGRVNELTRMVNDYELTCAEKNHLKESEIAKLKQSISEMEEERCQMRDQCKNIEGQLEEKTRLAESAMSEVNSLKYQMQKTERDSDYQKQEGELKLIQLKNEKEQLEISLKNEILSWQEKHSQSQDSTAKIQEELRKAEAEIEKLQKVTESYKVHYNKKKEVIEALKNETLAHQTVGKEFRDKAEKLERQLKSIKVKSDSDISALQTYKQKVEKLEKDVAPLVEEIQAEKMKNKSLNNHIRSLEVQLEHADRQVREYQKKMEDAGTIFLGDNTEFYRMKRATDAESAHDVSLENILDNPRASRYSLRPREKMDSLDDSIFMDSPTVVKNSTEKTISNVTLKSGLSMMETEQADERRMSLRSQSRRISSSDSNLNKSILSTGSTNSTSSVPRGAGNMFSCEDEPENMFEWNRLSELQRRNTLCLPHLKTSYPVETQNVGPRKFTDDALRYSLIPSGSGKKRKKPNMIDEEDGLESHLSDNLKSSKQAKHSGTVYHKPGPPTPGNPASTRRLSGKETPKKGLKSPRTPVSSRKSKRTPRRTPAKQKTPVLRLHDVENGESTKKSKLSKMFSIGFTPKNKRLPRQQAFVDGTSSTSKVNRQPLKNKNFFPSRR